MNLFVGNLAYTLDDQGLRDIFVRAGTVISTKIITDKYSGRSRGFGLVKMGSEEEGKRAIEMFHMHDVDGRQLVVNEAIPRETKSQQ